MPSTYSLISSNVLSTSAASVTFSAIPSTYTDLVVRFSSRLDRAVTDSTSRISTNISGSVYSATKLRGNGSAASSSRQSALAVWELDTINAATSTANTFSSGEIYFPNYTIAAYKPSSYFVVQEDNTTAANTQVISQLLSSNTAISSITIDGYGYNFVAGSSFYLYGIKNS
jgi:hypothetical protein